MLFSEQFYKTNEALGLNETSPNKYLKLMKRKLAKTNKQTWKHYPDRFIKSQPKLKIKQLEKYIVLNQTKLKNLNLNDPKSQTIKSNISKAKNKIEKLKNANPEKNWKKFVSNKYGN